MSIAPDTPAGIVGLQPPGLPGSESELLRLRRNWLWLVILGVGIIATGVAAIGASFLATITTVLLFGILLTAAGMVQLVSAFLVRTWQGFFITALCGVLYLVVGVVMVEYPLRAAAVLTFVLAVSLLIGGAARVLFAATHFFPGRGWVLLNGVINFVLGLMIWQDWPAASLWVIGLFVGIDLVFNGWAWVMLGLVARSALPGPTRQPASPAP